MSMEEVCKYVGVVTYAMEMSLFAKFFANCFAGSRKLVDVGLEVVDGLDVSH